MATTISRTWYDTLVDDDGSGTVGTPWDKGEVDALLDAIDTLLAGNLVFGGLVSSDGQPRVVVRHSTTQSLTTEAWTSLTFDTEDVDVGALHSTVTNPSRLTIPTAADGFYLLVGYVNFAVSTTGVRAARILVNGSNVIGSAPSIPGLNSSGFGGGLNCVAFASLTAGMYVELQGWQNSGGALNTGHASEGWVQNRFFAVRLW